MKPKRKSKAKIKPVSKPKIRRVFGRLKNVEALGRRWTLEMRREGVFVKQRGARKWTESRVDFAAIISRADLQPELFKEVA